MTERHVVRQEPSQDPLVRECVDCQRVSKHSPRSDNGNPIARCKGCHSKYLKQYRERQWKRVKARNTWKNMIARCHDPSQGKGAPEGIPKYRDYGAKGVRVCWGWRDRFEAFLLDVGLPPSRSSTLDRLNPNFGYECGKCGECRVVKKKRSGSKRSHNFVDMTGSRVGMLVVLEYAGTKGASNGTRHRHSSLWRCRCDCGAEKLVTRACLRAAQRRGGAGSCGCMQGVGKKPRKPGSVLSVEQAGIRAVFGDYKIQARRRGLSWGLSIGQFTSLVLADCFYCGQEPSNRHVVRPNSEDHSGEFVYSGVDRVINDQGYCIENCVSCCSVCNHAKHKMTPVEFMEWIDRVHSHSFRSLSPRNCIWVDPKTQRANRKNSRWITAPDIETGEVLTMTIGDWSRKTGFSREVISQRIRSGWDEVRAVTQPLRRPRPHVPF